MSVPVQRSEVVQKVRLFFSKIDQVWFCCNLNPKIAKVKTTLFQFLLSAVALLSMLGLQAQESEARNFIIASFGYTYIPGGAALEEEVVEDGFFVPTIGFDYVREVSERWMLGLMVDVELGQYLVLEKNLERENATLFVFTGKYEFLEHWGLIGGGGLEVDSHNSLAIFRFGLERHFELENGWEIGIPFVLDYKRGYDTWALSVALAKKF